MTDFSVVSARIALAAVEYMEECSACLFCELGHVPNHDGVQFHDEECPLRGLELTVDVEALRAWATQCMSKEQEKT